MPRPVRILPGKNVLRNVSDVAARRIAGVRAVDDLEGAPIVKPLPDRARDRLPRKVDQDHTLKVNAHPSDKALVALLRCGERPSPSRRLERQVDKDRFRLQPTRSSGAVPSPRPPCESNRNEEKEI